MKKYEILSIDFETRSACDLKTAGLHVYAKDTSTDILCMAYAFDDQPVRIWKRGEQLPQDIVDHVKAGGEVSGHNVTFEYQIWNTVGVFKYGWPPLKLEQLNCTMAMSYAMGLPASLEKSAKALGLTMQKDMEGSKVMMRIALPKPDGTFHEPHTYPEGFEKLYAYCIVDVEVERGLRGRLMPLSPQERKVWILDQKINNRGIGIDVKAARAAILIVEVESERLNAEIKKATNGVVERCTNAKQLADYINVLGYKTEGVAKSHILDLLSRDDLPDNIRRALLLRQEAAKSSTAKLVKMLEGLSSDGRVKGCFQYHGAATGRFSGRRVQFQNMPRPKLKQKEINEIFELLHLVE
jgi:DNA polymerase